MEIIFSEYVRPNGTTWLYLSALLAIAVFFRFNRVFCLRNWDILALFLIVPGLLAVSRVDRQMLDLLGKANWPAGRPVTEFLDPNAYRLVHWGYGWLFAATGYWLVRSFADLALVRRPRLDPNLETGGLAFLGVSLLGFLMTEVVTKQPDPAGKASAVVAAAVLTGNREQPDVSDLPAKTTVNPGTAVYQSLVYMTVDTLMQRLQRIEEHVPPMSVTAVGVARSAAILAHLMILIGLVVVGWRHFGSPQTGVGMATLYLLVPLTAINVEKIDHLLPAALLTWAVAAYRHPRIVGGLFGLAGVFLFPLFLVPLWAGFYWGRGTRKFLFGFAAASAAVWSIVLLIDPVRSFVDVWLSAFNWTASAQPASWSGLWTHTTQFYRLPIFVVFVSIAMVVAVWPAQKNLGELIALSLVLILGIQFWFPERGGTYVAWYLPLLLMMVFRPNLLGTRPPELPARAA